MENRIDFTEEMKEIMKEWKGKILRGYIENADDGYVTIIRFLIGDKFFDIDNEYTLYVDSNGDEIEFSCFSCVEVDKKQSLETVVVGGKCKENIVGEKIEDVFIVKETEKDIYPNDEEVYEFSYEIALIIQTKNCFYVFWRDIIFNTIKIVVCKDIEGALESIKKSNENDEELKENDCSPTIILEKIVEKL